MNKQNLLIKITAIFLFAFISFSASAQDERSGDLDIEGSYTVYVNSLKNLNIEFTEEQKFEIESKRLENEDLIIQIDGISVRIMSRSSMEADVQWPKYSLKND
tara:strand:+ start:109 stop:417 length:309 start_codon:yes stop_codon:yes gene_type:complete